MVPQYGQIPSLATRHGQHEWQRIDLAINRPVQPDSPGTEHERFGGESAHERAGMSSSGKGV